MAGDDGRWWLRGAVGIVGAGGVLAGAGGAFPPMIVDCVRPPAPMPAPLPAAPLTDIEDFIPLPAYGWDIRPTTSPLDIEECATALVMAGGELAGAARLLRVSELRLQRVMGRSERLRRLHGELVALLNDRVLHEVRRAFDDDDGRRREWAVGQVVKSQQFQSHPFGAGGGRGRSVGIDCGGGRQHYVCVANVSRYRLPDSSPTDAEVNPTDGLGAQMRDVDLPIAILKEMVDADLTTGRLWWRARPRSHFLSDKGWRIQHVQWAGTPAAAAANACGYRRVKGFYLGRPMTMQAHRVIWALAHGRWPSATIDHIRGVRAGDGIANLREATQRQQNEAKGGWSGRLVGARPHGRRWESRIRSDGKLIHLGTFDTEEEAHAAYLAAKKVYHSFPRRFRMSDVAVAVADPPGLSSCRTVRVRISFRSTPVQSGSS